MWHSYPTQPPNNKWIFYYDDQTGKEWTEYGITRGYYTYFKIVD